MVMDIIGTIAIIKFPSKTKQAEKKKFATKILKQHKNIKTILEKAEKIKGRLRNYKIKYLLGEKQTETLFRESGCLFKTRVDKCYFSPRLSGDRLELAKKIKKNEKILVMFSGISPYSIVIAKKAKPKQLTDIELSKTCHKYAKQNIKLNKLENIKLIQGDVKKKVTAKLGKFDRIIMARPQLKETFLSQAFKVAKKATIIHFYDFLTKDEFDSKRHIQKIQEQAKKSKKKIKILKTKKTREIAPYKYHIRVDFKVL